MKKVWEHLIKQKDLVARVAVIFLVGILATPFLISLFSPCATVKERAPVEGSQGFRVWYGETLKTFEHTGKPVCVPEGWMAVGALQETERGAIFERGKTGILVRENAFTSQEILLPQSAYSVTLLYPTTTSPDVVAEYVFLTTQAFEQVGSVFEEPYKGEKKKHTVLVTAGVAGNTIDPGTRVYPDPHARVTVIMRTPDHPRSEELLIHAVTHLYNRHEPRLRITDTDDPFSEETWQELEATWMEMAFSSYNHWRFVQLDYLYNVHRAVTEKNFSLIQYPTFTDEQGLLAITPRVELPRNSSYEDTQYGHYTLAPLVMHGIQGLLIEQGAPVTLEDIVRETHREGVDGFFTQLARVLPPEDMAAIRAWINGEKAIPADLLENALNFYNTQNNERFPQ